MGFKVGEKIVYPNHGVSVVEKIGEGFQTEPVAPRSFYHLRLLSNNSRVMVPVGNTSLIGLRRLTQRKDITGLMKTLGDGRFSATGDWKGRYKQNLDKMKSGGAARDRGRPEDAQLHLLAQDPVLPREEDVRAGQVPDRLRDRRDQRPRREGSRAPGRQGPGAVGVRAGRRLTEPTRSRISRRGGASRPVLFPRENARHGRDPRKALPRARSIVMLLVGVLVGFARRVLRGGRRAARAPAARRRRRPGGDRRPARRADAVASSAIPRIPEILMDLGNLYYDREDWDQAIAALREGAAQGAQEPQPPLGPRRRAPQPRRVRSGRRLLPEGAGERPEPLAVAPELGARRGLRPARTRPRRSALFDEVKKRYPEIPQLDKIQEQISSLRAARLMARLVLLLFVVFLFLTVLRGLRIFFAACLRGSRAAGRGAARAPRARRRWCATPSAGPGSTAGSPSLRGAGGETVPVCSEKCRRRLEAGR